MCLNKQISLHHFTFSKSECFQELLMLGSRPRDNDYLARYLIQNRSKKDILSATTMMTTKETQKAASRPQKTFVVK